MTAAIRRMSGDSAYDLIYSPYLDTLSVVDQETMHRAMHNSAVVWVCYDVGEILCCWGLIPPTLVSDRAYLWLYTTEHYTKHLFYFIRHSQRAVEEALREYPHLHGHCKTNAPKSIRWLRWLGAVFAEPTGDLIPFEIKARTWQQP